MRTLAVLLALPALLILAACGSGDDSVPAVLKDVCVQSSSAAKDDIKVDNPKSGADVNSPLRVTGTINAAASQFLLTIVDAAGTHISDYPGHSSQPGAPVPFQQDLPFGVQEKVPACLWVYLNSAPDPAEAIRIPINLLPAGTTTP